MKLFKIQIYIFKKLLLIPIYTHLLFRRNRHSLISQILMQMHIFTMAASGFKATQLCGGRIKPLKNISSFSDVILLFSLSLIWTLHLNCLLHPLFLVNPTFWCLSAVLMLLYVPSSKAPGTPLTCFCWILKYINIFLTLGFVKAATKPKSPKCWAKPIIHDRVLVPLSGSKSLYNVLWKVAPD